MEWLVTVAISILAGVSGYLISRSNQSAGFPRARESTPTFDEQVRRLKALAVTVDEVLEREQRLYARLAKRAQVDEREKAGVDPALAREGAPNGLAFRSGADVLAYARQKGATG